jgi:hypothetical protein
MALFFDSEWFDARLAAVGLARGDAARALGLSDAQIGDVWKDQRELSARDVAVLANLLNASPQDIAKHAGVSTPVPKAAASDPAHALEDISQRLSRVERMLVELKALVLDLRRE